MSQWALTLSMGSVSLSFSLWCLYDLLKYSCWCVDLGLPKSTLFYWFVQLSPLFYSSFDSSFTPSFWINWKSEAHLLFPSLQTVSLPCFLAVVNPPHVTHLKCQSLSPDPSQFTNPPLLFSFGILNSTRCILLKFYYKK